MNKKEDKNDIQDEDELQDDNPKQDDNDEEIQDDDFDENISEGDEEESSEHIGIDNKKKIIAGIIILLTIIVIYKIFFGGSSSEDTVVETIDVKERNVVQSRPEQVIDAQVTQIDEKQMIEIRNEDILQTNSDLVDLPDFSKIEFPEIPEPTIEELPDLPSMGPDLPMVDIPQLPQFNQESGGDLPPLEPPSMNTAKSRGVSILAFGGNKESDQDREGGGNLRDLASGDVDGALSMIDQITGRYNKGEGFATEHDSPQASSVPRIATTYYGDRNYMITQGKIFDAVLETAISATSGEGGGEGMLRAVITRDVYSDAGYNVLLPRGTRLIGVYNSATQQRGKVDIIWSRAIRPDGIDIAINSPGVDQIGRNGIQGIEDTKFINLIKNAILISGITVGGGVAGQKLAGDDAKISSSKDKDGKVSESGRIIDFAIRDAVNNLTDIFTNYIERNSDTSSSVYVNQGTPVKVFVTSDLVFSKSVSNLVRDIKKPTKP